MADADPYSSPPDWQSVGESFGAGLMKNIVAANIQKAIVAAITEAEGASKAVWFKVMPEVATLIGDAMAVLEETGSPLVAKLAAPSIDALFGGTDAEAALNTRISSDGAAAVGRAVVEAMFKALQTGTPSNLQPTMEGATRVAGVAAGAAIGGQANAVLTALLSDLLPFEIGHFEAITKLPDEVLRSLGLGRLVRQALAPLIKIIAADPMLWYLNNQYRPALLPAGTAVREIIRATDDDSPYRQQLAYHGFSDDWIEAMMREASKYRSVADAAFMVQIGQWSTDIATQHLRDAGYDVLGAQDELDLQRWKRINAFEKTLATAAIAAYARGVIDDGALDTYAHGSTFDSLESAQIAEEASARKIFNQKQLSAAEAEACALAGVLAVADYRAALERENYSPDAVDALELLIRQKIDADTAKAAKAAAAAAAKAAQTEAKQAAAAAKAEATAKAKALAQLGSLASLATAFIDGQIPIERYNEVASAHYDPDTVAILDAELQTKQAAHAAAVAKAANAAKVATTKGLSAGALSAAVLAGVISPNDMAAQLANAGLPQEAIDVLVATTSAKLAAKNAAAATKAAAAAKAKTKGLNLSQAEQLVIAGHWTFGQFNDLVASLGYDAGSIANLDALVQDKINTSTKAASLRAAAGTTPGSKGLTTSEFLAAVVLGDKTVDEYQTFLVNAGYDADAVTTLSEEAQQKLDAANLARSKRTAAATSTDASKAPLADVTRAARLGLITIAAYDAALTARGYTADDLALENDLMVEAIAKTTATATKTKGTATVPGEKALTLAQTAALVKDNQATIGQYQQLAVNLGYSSDDAAALAQLLSDQVAAAQAAQQRHAVILARTANKHPSLATMETAVVDGIQTMDQYNAYLTEQGFDAADAQILDALLQLKVAAAAAKAAKA